MHARFVFIAATLIGTGALAAEPPKAPVQNAAQPQTAAPQIVLASAVDSRPASPADAQPTTAPKRPRVGRVTTCRCGGQDADPDQESQPPQ